MKEIMNNRRFHLIAIVAATLAAASSDIPAQSLRESFDLAVPRPPAAVTIDGTIRLAYELHVTNFTRVPLELTAIDVLDGDSNSRTIASFQDSALARILERPGVRPANVDAHIVAPGASTIAFFWLSVEPAQTPDSLDHRLTFREANTTDAPGGVVTGGRVAVRTESPVVLGPPLRGGPWVAAYHPELMRGHRRVFFALDGVATIPARFAIDWFKLDQTGQWATGDGSRITDWHGYGEDVFAAANAVVVATRDTIAEDSLIAHIAHGLEKASGNYVTLDLGGGRYISYEHLKPGSIRVAPGDMVREGDVIAQIGDTGDTSGPHLHMHVSDDGATTLAGEGVPFVIRGFDVIGRYSSIMDIGRRAWIPTRANEPSGRKLEMPAPNVVIQFTQDGEARSTVEFRTYNLRPGSRDEFHRLVIDEAIPMLETVERRCDWLRPVAAR